MSADVKPPAPAAAHAYLARLNADQRDAAEHGLSGAAAEDSRALLIIAGAGSGKTNTLAHRVAHLVETGADPRRILLLTFSRRAAAEMTRRAQQILASRKRFDPEAFAGKQTNGRLADAEPSHAEATNVVPAHAEAPRVKTSDAAPTNGESADAGAREPAHASPAPRTAPPARTPAVLAAERIHWSGTFHALANRLLRLHAESVGLDPGFTVLDRGDAADLMDVLRSDLLEKQAAKRAGAEPFVLGDTPSSERRGADATKNRFPRKDTCLAIYSHCVNAQREIEASLDTAFPWCREWAEELRELFAAYVTAKQQQAVLDYDDLLLYWYYLMQEPALAEAVRERFDHVLVDEYQDTNALQAGILLALRPEGTGLTVVGDDAQAIYSFRAATVRNILDFPQHFTPPARVVTLERNYRSTQPVLDACNAVIDLARERFAKRLHSTRKSCEKPRLVLAEDENAQVDYVVENVLAHREAGIPLRHQAVLMRTGHHGDALEVELGRRGIPYVKFGGLKFLEAAHVKDLLCVLRFAENPRDGVAGFRVMQLLPGIGPKSARAALDALAAAHFSLAALTGHRPPAAAREDWGGLCELLTRIAAPKADWPAQLGWVRDWYAPHLARMYDSPQVRIGDLEQLEQISAGYPSRERFLSELTLDPPSATGDEAGPPHLDEDYLILSTIHSSKGQEWDAVFVLNVVDGCIPSDMATGKPEEIEEERRLLYVAMTRAKDHLHLLHPQRMFVRQQHRHGDRHLYTPRSRFLPDETLTRFEHVTHGAVRTRDAAARRTNVRVDVAARLRQQWTAPGRA